MTVAEIVDKLSLEVVTGQFNLNVEVTGGCVCDLLSSVMAKARAGNIWVTIQAHPNIVAVASLLELAAVIVADGVELEGATRAKAEEESVPILVTPMTAFAVVGELAKLGVMG
ncbi:MAG: serine kinase [Chloroflexi bacterium]|nr:serine kinase [Chloroflexota bacterium]